MSFEVKYDERGNVITPNPQPDNTPEPEEQPQDIVEELPEAAHASPSEPEQKFQKAEMDKSWSDLRKKAESAERERDDLRRQLDAQRYVPQQPEAEEDLSINIGDDELVEGRMVSKVTKKLAKLEQQLAQQQAYNTQIAIQNKLVMEHPDFNDVVSETNVAKLKDEYPQIFATLVSSQDLYSQGISAYTMIKKFGISPDNNDGMASMQRIQRNTAKPKPVATISSQKGDTPLARANPFAEGLTDDLKQALLKEMNDAVRNKF